MIRAGIVHIDRGSEGWLDYLDDPVDPRLHDAVPNDQVLRLIEAWKVASGSGRSVIVSRKHRRAALPSPARAQAKSTRQAFQSPTAGRSTCLADLAARHDCIEPQFTCTSSEEPTRDQTAQVRPELHGCLGSERRLVRQGSDRYACGATLISDERGVAMSVLAQSD